MLNPNTRSPSLSHGMRRVSRRIIALRPRSYNCGFFLHIHRSDDVSQYLDTSLVGAEQARRVVAEGHETRHGTAVLGDNDFLAASCNLVHQLQTRCRELGHLDRYGALDVMTILRQSPMNSESPLLSKYDK